MYIYIYIYIYISSTAGDRVPELAGNAQGGSAESDAQGIVQGISHNIMCYYKYTMIRYHIIVDVFVLDLFKHIIF